MNSFLIQATVWHDHKSTEKQLKLTNQSGMEPRGRVVLSQSNFTLVEHLRGSITSATDLKNNHEG